MDPILAQWARFIDGLPADGPVRPEILASWERSRAAGVDPQASQYPGRRLPPDELQRRLEASAGLLVIARPHLEWASSFLGDAPHVIYLTDRDGIVLLEVGHAALGTAFGLVLGAERSERVLGTNAADLALATNRAQMVGGAEHFSRWLHDCQCTAAPLHVPDGTVTAALGICTRRTESRSDIATLVAHLAFAIDRELAASRDQVPREEGPHRALSDVFADYTCVARFDGRQMVLESVSEGFTSVTGYTRDEFNSQEVILGAIYPEDMFLALQSLDRLMSGQSDSNEIRMITKKGDIRWLRYLARPERQAGVEGELRIHGAVQDITERKHAGQRLEESEQRFRQLAEHIREGSWMSDPLRTRMLYCSPAFEEIWGRPCADIADGLWALLDSVHPEDREAVLSALDPQSRGEPTDVEYRILRPDGSVRWVRDRAFPIKDSAGQVYRVVGVADDITERRQAEEERRGLAEQLQRQNAELETADRRKDEFLAMLAHELRNPLAPIRTALHIMKQPTANGVVIGQVREIAERQVRHMARLLDDLLDVARISRGRIELRKEKVDLVASAASAVQAIRPLVEEYRHELTVTLAPGPLWVEGDPTRLEQVLTNLLHNAVKYTEPGGHIWLSVERVGTGAVLRVRDNGIGIAPEMLDRIFDLFVQAERRLDRAQGGVGIGLTLVRQLIELHGGTVAAFSLGPGQGSEFVICLPALPAAEARVGEPVGDRATGGGAIARRVLVVDDNADAADSLAMVLGLAGQEVRVAYDGPAALLLARSFLPQVIFLDVGMPGMDGYEAARHLRQQPGLQNAVLVAVTGWGQEQDRRQAQQAGFDHHLVKPVEPEVLQRLLIRQGTISERGPA